MTFRQLVPCSSADTCPASQIETWFQCAARSPLTRAASALSWLHGQNGETACRIAQRAVASDARCSRRSTNSLPKRTCRAANKGSRTTGGAYCGSVRWIPRRELHPYPAQQVPAVHGWLLLPADAVRLRHGHDLSGLVCPCAHTCNSASASGAQRTWPPWTAHLLPIVRPQCVTARCWAHDVAAL